jgi:hypothetical protein
MISATQFAPEACATYGAVCTNGGGVDAGVTVQPVPIECNQVSDCVANGKAGATACCMQGGHFTIVAGCGYPKLTQGVAVVCEGTAGGAATGCAAGEMPLCSSQADCPTGTTCTPAKWKIYQVGVCQ